MPATIATDVMAGAELESAVSFFRCARTSLGCTPPASCISKSLAANFLFLFLVSRIHPQNPKNSLSLPIYYFLKLDCSHLHPSHCYPLRHLTPPHSKLFPHISILRNHGTFFILLQVMQGIAHS